MLRIFIYYKNWHKFTFYPQRQNCHATHSTILTLLTSKEFNSPIKLPKFSNTWLISVTSLLWLLCDEAMINCSKDFSADATALWWNVLTITNVHPLFPPIFMLDKNDVPEKKKNKIRLLSNQTTHKTSWLVWFESIAVTLFNTWNIHHWIELKIFAELSQFIRRKLLALIWRY